MKEVTLYYADCTNGFLDSRGFATAAEALAVEKQHREFEERWKENSPETKLEKLISELNQCQIINPETIATCTFDSIRVKAMVRVCQKFAEENKQYLNYY
jgi:hypothetical protein